MEIRLVKGLTGQQVKCLTGPDLLSVNRWSLLSS